MARLYTALKTVPPYELGVDWSEPHAEAFAAAMNDDFNTSEAVAQLFELAGEVNRSRDARLAGQLQGLGRVLGLLERTPDAFLQDLTGLPSALSVESIEARIAERAEAKSKRDFARADALRAELLEAGIVLEDRPGGLTEWRRA